MSLASCCAHGLLQVVARCRRPGGDQGQFSPVATQETVKTEE